MLVFWARVSATTCFDLPVSSFIGVSVLAPIETRGGYDTKAFSNRKEEPFLGASRYHPVN
jgi:hypothetical protein